MGGGGEAFQIFLLSTGSAPHRTGRQFATIYDNLCRRVLQEAPPRGRQLYSTFPSAPDPFFKTLKAPYLTLRVATPSGATPVKHRLIMTFSVPSPSSRPLLDFAGCPEFLSRTEGGSPTCSSDCYHDLNYRHSATCSLLSRAAS